MILNSYSNSVSGLKGFFNRTLNPKLDILAKTVGFVKRNDGKLLPETFVKAFTIGLMNTKNQTLQAVANACEDIQENLSISKEAIYQRLKTGASLLEQVFNRVLECSVGSALDACNADILKSFNNVYVADSTAITLGKRMSKIAPGRTANKEKGALCIQSIFSLVNRSFKKIDTFWGTQNDIAYTKELAKNISANDLIIFDMGYKHKSGFKAIMEKGAFFLTRASNSAIYYSVENRFRYSREQLDIVNILEKSNGIVDMELLTGHDPERRIKCRFVAIRVPESLINEKLCKLYKKRRKTTLKKKDIELLKWNIFITNIPAEKLSAEEVCSLYRLRWQIEILFKACKSHLCLDDLGIGGKHQTECFMYGRLITAVIMASIYSKYYAFIYKSKQRELSVLKFFSNLKYHANKFTQIVFKDVIDYVSLAALLNKIASKSLCEKRKRKTSLECLIEHQTFKLE